MRDVTAELKELRLHGMVSPHISRYPVCTARLAFFWRTTRAKSGLANAQGVVARHGCFLNVTTRSPVWVADHFFINTRARR